MRKKHIFSLLLACALLLSSCTAGKGTVAEDPNPEKEENPAAVSQLDKIDMTQWNYNAENDVYWQTGIVYCEAPADETY